MRLAQVIGVRLRECRQRADHRDGAGAERHGLRSKAAAGPETHAGEEPRPCFLLRQRVYWEDTDAGGVVYHASYLRFLERGRTELELLEARTLDGGVLYVRYAVR